MTMGIRSTSSPPKIRYVQNVTKIVSNQNYDFRMNRPVQNFDRHHYYQATFYRHVLKTNNSLNSYIHIYLYSLPNLTSGKCRYNFS